MTFKSSLRSFVNFLFVRIEVGMMGWKLFLNQYHYAANITTLPNCADFEMFRSLMHLLAWLVHTRPYILALANAYSQTTAAEFEVNNLNLLNSVVRSFK